MEIRYQRLVPYSIDLDQDKKLIGQLAKHLDISRTKLIKLVENETLFDEVDRGDVETWINHNENLATFDATTEIEDLEIS